MTRIPGPVQNAADDNAAGRACPYRHRRACGISSCAWRRRRKLHREEQTPSSGQRHSGNREPMRLTFFVGGFVLALMVAFGGAAAGLCADVRAGGADRGSASRHASSLRPPRFARRNGPGSRCIWRSSRAGMSIGAIPAIPGCPPKSPGTCHPVSPPAQSNGRRPSALSSSNIGNYGYAGAVDLLVPLTAARSEDRRSEAGRGCADRGACELARLLRNLHSGRGGLSLALPVAAAPSPVPIPPMRRCLPPRASVSATGRVRTSDRRIGQ